MYGFFIIVTLICFCCLRLAFYKLLKNATLSKKLLTYKTALLERKIFALVGDIWLASFALFQVIDLPF